MRDYGFSLIRVFPYKNRIYILCLYGKIQVSENLYSRIFYAVLGKDIVDYGDIKNCRF